MTSRPQPRTVRPPRLDDRGSMPLAVLVTIVGLLLSAALVPVVMNQLGNTRTVAGRTHELQAAQAGIDVALGQLRSSDGNVNALPPCRMTGRPAPDRSAYQVEITYYPLSTDGTDPEPLACPPADVPATAKLKAVGGPADDPAALAEDGAGSRTIEATYTFRTSNENIAGGAIQLAEPATNPLCMDAGTEASPTAGTQVRMHRCKAGGSSAQRFAYTADLNLKLVGSEVASAESGMCLDVPYPRKNRDRVTFQPCAGASARQQWSLNDSSNFVGVPDPNPAPPNNTYCLNLENAGVSGAGLVLGSCGGGTNVRIFRPKPEAGAGMASDKTGQLVNYQQFSRCLDVTDFKPTSSYMIVWFCKQDPNGNVPWNQKWSLPEAATSLEDAKPERIRTAGSGHPGYCLRSPGSTAAGKYVTMLPCTAAGPLANDSLKWTVFGDTGNYTTSYRIVDHYGYCMVPTDLRVTKPDTHSDGTAKVRVAPCDKSELQKWNAPANFNQPLVLTNTRER